jgi:hypothetical protein
MARMYPVYLRFLCCTDYVPQKKIDRKNLKSSVLIVDFFLTLLSLGLRVSIGLISSTNLTIS